MIQDRYRKTALKLSTTKTYQNFVLILAGLIERIATKNIIERNLEHALNGHTVVCRHAKETDIGIIS